jgi:histidine phosphotransferase ChpT
LPADIRGFGKLVVNAVLLAAEALGQNGTISVEARSDGAAVVATGRAPNLDAERSAALTGRTAPADLDPRSIHAYVTARFATHYGILLAVKQSSAERLDFVLTVSQAGAS